MVARNLGHLQQRSWRSPRPSELKGRPGRPEPAPKHGMRWSDDEDAWLTRRYHEGAEISIIATELQRSLFACSTRLQRLQQQRNTHCAQCGTALQQAVDGGHPVQFCEYCARARRLAPLPEPRACSWCGTPFRPADAAARNEFCSKKCANLAWYARVRARRDEARARFGASGDFVTTEQLNEVIRLRAAGASWREIEMAAGVHRRAAQQLLAEIDERTGV